MKVLLYDGLCGFCDGAVQWILERDRRGTLHFAPLQGDFGQALLAQHAEARAVDSLILAEVDRRPGGELRATALQLRSAAALGAAREMGGVWARVGAVLRVVPRPLRDALYDLFARHRYRWFGRRADCRLPSDAERRRFL